MKRALTLAAILSTAVLAGCIQPPAEEEAEASTTLPPPDTAGNMTREERGDDTTVAPCLLEGGLNFPNVALFCATRVVAVGGELSLTTLPVVIDTSSGDVTVELAEKDTWSVVATVVARGTNEADATAKAAEISVVTTIGEPDAHALTLMAEAPDGSDARVTFVVQLPPETLYDLVVDTGSGDVAVSDVRAVSAVIDTGSGDVSVGGDFQATTLAIDTGSGDVAIDGAARDVVVDTGSGDVSGSIKPLASGAMTFATGSGSVALEVPEDARHGYEIMATTGSGSIDITLKDGDVRTEEESHASFVTKGLGSRAVRTSVILSTGSGDVSVAPMTAA